MRVILITCFCFCFLASRFDSGDENAIVNQIKEIKQSTTTSPTTTTEATVSPNQNILEENIPNLNIPNLNLNVPTRNIPKQTKLPVQNVPKQTIPVRNVTNQNIPKQTIPVQNVPKQNIPAQNISSQNTRVPNVPKQITSTRKFTPEEIKKLKEFRNKVGDAAQLPEEYMKRDEYMIRWLKSKSMNVDAAVTDFKESIKWKDENKVKNALTEELYRELRVREPFYTIEGVDRVGGPIGISEARKADPRKYILGGQTKTYKRTNIQLLEGLEHRIYQLAKNSTTGEDISQATIIVDVDGYNLRSHACLACMPVYFEQTREYEKNYPLIYRKIFFINCPRIFAPLLQLLREFMSAGTRETLEIYGPNKSEWAPKLLEEIPSNQLHSYFGGTA